MATCDICGKEDLKGEAGVALHKRFMHEVKEEPIAPQAEAIEADVRVETSRPGPKSNGRMSTGGLNRPGKMVKMIQARCQVCNPRGQGRRGWWETCTHDPYFHIEAKPGATEFKELQDGTIVKLPEPDVEYQKVANWKQIPDDPGITSARSVRIQVERGSKFPRDLGYSPVCDYRNCWEPDPQIHSNRVINVEGAAVRVGDYHERREAAMMTLRLNGTPVFVGLDQDIERRNAQLDAVQIL